MKRIDFLDVLNMCKPALSTQDFVPVLSHFCFNKGTVTAYNDQLAITCDVDVPLKGAINGSLLLKLLSKSKAKEVELDQEGSFVNMKIGRSKSKLPVIPKEDFLFKKPSIKRADDITISDGFITALKYCLVSVGTNAMNPTHLAVTLVLSKNKGILYTTDNHTISKFEVSKIKYDGKDKTVLLPVKFCEQLIRLATSLETPTTLTTGKGFIRTTFKDSVVLFSKLVEDSDALDFEKVIKSTIKGANSSEQSVDIPPTLLAALDRSGAVLGKDLDGITSFTLENKKLKLYSKSALGEVKEQVSIKSDVDGVEFDADAALLLRILEYCSEIWFASNCIVLKKGTYFTHLIAHIKV